MKTSPRLRYPALVTCGPGIKPGASRNVGSEDRPCIAARPRPPIFDFYYFRGIPFSHTEIKIISGRGKGGEEGTTAHYRCDSISESTLSLHLQVLDYGSPIINIYFDSY